jgi:cytochrome P450
MVLPSLDRSNAGVTVEQFDHHSEHFAQHWRDTYRELRSTCPVAHSELHGGFSVVTRYSDVKQALSDPETFACRRDVTLDDGTSLAGGVTVPVNPVQMGMMELDPPESQAFRKVLAPRFTAKAIKEYRPRLAEMVSWIVDRVIGSGRIDFVDDLANPLPALVSLDYFGLPLDKWEFYATALHKAAYREKGSARAVGELLVDLEAVMAQRRATLMDGAESRNDVLDRLLTQEVDGAPMAPDVALNMMFMLLNGGIDTSTALIASMFLYLGRHPEYRAQLAAEPTLIPAAVDEMLRYFTPGTGVARTVVKAVELGGTQLEPGDRILLGLGSANLDADVFAEPDEVELARDNSSKHLAFGYGVHRCLGAFLAPAEMIALLEEVLMRMPEYAIDVDRVRQYPTIPLVNGYLSMPATFAPGERVLSGFDEHLPLRDTALSGGTS